MSLDAPVLRGEDLSDRLERRPVRRSELALKGMVWDVRRDTVDLGAAGEVVREYVDHPGAVGILVLREVEGRGQVLLIQQYRHPVGGFEWELPAGLLDVAGEAPWLAAARELHEEVDLIAGSWDVLIDFFGSPGGNSEALRIFLARDLTEVQHDDLFTREDEEQAMRVGWVDLDEAHDAVLRGQVHNSGAVIGILTAHAARAGDWATLRPHDAPWPQHPSYR
ncbi:MAG: 8-oxo-dGDP phosphatase [Actinomycetota bacterium]|jgi:ADP-ribose pyrophosphatase|nr:8-oxo-dGDP phosphatase [Actinomycetota bacterium]